ncbi:unnamed protein product [Ceutorhynchus assimilis]|uniref:BRCA1-associated ATM activator 1 n=1 Tax=Ceutorhynchus assimilis TaxID=467358 RepID=A0A9N9MU63_9CUCU|nr:unnamed protein product [Ceutorhynchus assimilis]
MENNASSLTSDKKNEKIKKALQKFLDPNFKLKNDVYLNLFLTHLFGKSVKKQEISIKQKDHFCQWLIQACTLWSQTKIDPPSVILAFTLNFARHLSTDEATFVRLDGQNVYKCLVGLAKTNLENDASVTLGWVTLLYSFMEHTSGVNWILASNYWCDIVIMGRDAHTMYIRKKAYQFVAKLLGKSININRNFCCNLIRVLTKPLYDTLNSPNRGSNQPLLIENSALFELVKPNLIFLSEVLEILLKDTQCDVIHLFISLKTIDLVKKLQILSQIEDFSFELVKIRCMFLFANFRTEESDETLTMTHVMQDSKAFCNLKNIFDTIEAEMDKDHFRCVIKICYFARNLYGELLGSLPLCIRKGEPIAFQNQMILIETMPMMIYVSERQGINLEELLADTYKRDFCSKIYKMAAIRTMEMYYRWKERLVQRPGLMDDINFALQYIMKSKHTLKKEQVGLIFQPLVYTFRVLVGMLKADVNIDSSSINFTHTVMETLIDLVKTFDLTWRESIETISIMDTTCDLLQHQQLQQKLAVAALRVLNLSFEKCLCPNMALLLDNSEDSAVARTGDLLYRKCHDVSWEVRDTALECVCALSLNAKSKFPSFTNILLESELPQLVIQMALHDGEFYVRTTAFKCLQEMIEIQTIWDKFMEIDNFLQKILNVFENETEGVARKEAAKLVLRIYKHQNYPEEILPRVYDIMTHAVVGDLHWEVKSNALDFWFYVIEEKFKDQGMEECVFPPVIFAKEQKKIVTMTEAETVKRMIMGLNQMSHVGCLYVLKTACLDECEVEVTRKLSAMIERFAYGFRKYKVSFENMDLEQPTIIVPSPCSTTTNTASCSDFYDVNSPAFLSSLLDTALSPLPVPPSPSLNINCMCPDSPMNSISGDSGYGTQCSEQNNDKETPSYDSVRADLVLDDLLNGNDMSFLEQIYNPKDQMQNTNSQMQKRQYLAPSEFVKFIYDASVNLPATEENKSLNGLNEFDSLLDDILKEYNIVDINSMDCY